VQLGKTFKRGRLRRPQGLGLRNASTPRRTKVAAAWDGDFV